MIDEFKIYIEAKDYSKKGSGGNDSLYGFAAGAKWMQEELLKDLWHPASEKPKEFNHYGFAALYVLQYNHQIRMVLYNKSNMSWKNVISINEYWLYVDDLLPKEGGNHD